MLIMSIRDVGYLFGFVGFYVFFIFILLIFRVVNVFFFRVLVMFFFVLGFEILFIKVIGVIKFW